MGLSPELTEEIDAIIYDNRILWETWMQSAEDFSTLKENLTKRGYNNLPTHASPIHAKTRHKKEETKLPAEKPKTMLRKKT
jgi:tRNA G26 N,N-dimethylase Trm1